MFGVKFSHLCKVYSGRIQRNLKRNLLDLLELLFLAIGRTHTDQIISFSKDDFKKNSLVSNRVLFSIWHEKLMLNWRTWVKLWTFYQEIQGSWRVVFQNLFDLFIIFLYERDKFLYPKEIDVRSTMGQKRLNNVAIPQIYNELVDKLNLDKLVEEFIVRNTKRTNVFALLKDVS